jgi:hypothetical protein
VEWFYCVRGVCSDVERGGFGFVVRTLWIECAGRGIKCDGKRTTV